MYAWYRYHHLARAGVGAALLCLLGTCQPALLEVVLGALDVVWTFNTRIGELPREAAVYFRRQGCCVLLRSERVFGVSIDRDDSARAWHLELEICVVRHRIEFCKCGSSEQGVIATAERDYVED